jgi:hypothetical protein
MVSAFQNRLRAVRLTVHLPFKIAASGGRGEATPICITFLFVLPLAFFLATDLYEVAIAPLGDGLNFSAWHCGQRVEYLWLAILFHGCPRLKNVKKVANASIFTGIYSLRHKLV